MNHYTIQLTLEQSNKLSEDLECYFGRSIPIQLDYYTPPNKLKYFDIEGYFYRYGPSHKTISIYENDHKHSNIYNILLNFIKQPIRDSKFEELGI